MTLLAVLCSSSCLLTMLALRHRYRKRHKQVDAEVLKSWAWQILCGLVSSLPVVSQATPTVRLLLLLQALLHQAQRQVPSILQGDCTSLSIAVLLPL